MKRLFCLLAISALSIPALMTAASEKKTRDETTRRLDEAASVFTEIMAAQDKSIPQDLLEKAHCIVVVPGMKKGAFIVGGEFGKGFISCRSSENRAWSAPAAVRLEGGSVGFQIGGSETDVVMLVTNERGVDKLLSSQFTLGGEGEVAAGPVGRTAAAETDAKLTAEILTWSRSRGVFAGISLKGATLRQDSDANESLYGKRLENRDIVMKKMAVPEPARKFVSTLNQYAHARG